MTDQKTAIGEAPGRLDFLGGVADYSGSLVLEAPLRLQTRVTLGVRDEPGHRFVPRAGQAVTLEPGILRGARSLDHGVLRGLREQLQAAGAPGWVMYPAGCLAVFAGETGWEIPESLEIWVRSEVPMSRGLSSSAALEIATLRAARALSGLAVDDKRLAVLGQLAENHVAASPCGLMDQLTSSCGVPGALLPILCRPDTLHKPVRLPKAVLVIGWLSDEERSTAGDAYGRARTAAFMGKRILRVLSGKRVAHTCDFSLTDYEKFENGIPQTLSGAEFANKYYSVSDPLSRVRQELSYPVRAALRFAISENARAHRVEEILRGEPTAGELREIGGMLDAGNADYSAMGLGSPGTDRMTAALRELGPDQGILGARVSGGGGGGTLVVLLRREGLSAFEKLARETGLPRWVEV